MNMRTIWEKTLNTDFIYSINNEVLNKYKRYNKCAAKKYCGDILVFHGRNFQNFLIENLKTVIIRANYIATIEHYIETKWHCFLYDYTNIFRPKKYYSNYFNC